VGEGQVGKLTELGRRTVGRAGPSPDEKVAELRAIGFNDEAIAAHLQRNGYTVDSAVELWECHEDAFAVYRRCQFNAIAGFGGAAFLGIASLEIEAACRAEPAIPYTTELVDDVQAIARGAAAVLNESKG
jgi:hypothetical protein